MLYEFDAYTAARRVFDQPQERDNLLMKLFGIDLKKFLFEHPTTAMPYFASEHEGKYRIDMITSYVGTLTQKVSINTDPTEICDWMPKVQHFAGYFRFLQQQKETFSMSRHQQTLAMVQAITCSCEQDRVLDQKCQTHIWNGREIRTSISRKMSAGSFILQTISPRQVSSYSDVITQS